MSIIVIYISIKSILKYTNTKYTNLYFTNAQLLVSVCR